MDGVPKYLRKRWKEERWRVGNELREARYWEEEKERECGGEEETWEHVLETCVGEKEGAEKDRRR